ncbi:DUF1659 domain-containing protein [Inconstantimicrobium mannanitabidum]|uniref:Uncharacterized protein n=1 Tax=Inconstantimicrobium mannanitabidum TaxID=1604901 RepID=A0ACB5RIL1_9CLOT|nr:DUF1659 domain-containing protein [Clostridium sp. TW13]GKX68971.1 hypothetical protein rsdtw13_42290 [Clostridium sp. TW13]
MEKSQIAKDLVIKVQTGVSGTNNTPVYQKLKLINIDQENTDEDIYSVCSAMANLMDPNMPKVFQRVDRYLLTN